MKVFLAIAFLLVVATVTDAACGGRAMGRLRLGGSIVSSRTVVRERAVVRGGCGAMTRSARSVGCSTTMRAACSAQQIAPPVIPPPVGAPKK